MKISLFILLLIISLRPQVIHAESYPASLAYILQAESFDKTKSGAINRLSACNRDWVVLDASYSSEIPWGRADIDMIRNGLAGRKVIAYISIGEAEDYRPYWRKEWGVKGRLTAARPAWLGIENPEWKGNYRVKYWHVEWQKIMLAVVDEAMKQGFDGVYLDIVDGFETFEQNGEEFLADRVNPETKQSYRRDMVDWIKAIASCARARNPAALVIPQNGSQLTEHADFLKVISAISIEDLFTDGNKIQSRMHTNEVLEHIKRLTASKKPTLLIEYSAKPERRALSIKMAKANGLVWLLTDRQLKTLGESGK